MRRLSLAISAVFLVFLVLVACGGRPSHPPALVFPTYVAGIPTLPPRGVTPTPAHPLVTHHQQYAVSAVAWSPNGTFVASSSWNGTVQIWRASNGQLIKTYQVSGGATTVAWSLDGKNLAAAGALSGPSAIKVWDMASGQLIWSTAGHTGQITALTWSPDSSRLASASADGTVKLWDAASGNLLLTYTGHQAMVNTVAWSPDGTRLASGSNDKTVRVWDANTGATLVIYQHHTSEVLSLSWSPDGRRIVSGSLDGTAQIWDAQSGKPLVVTKGGPEVSQTEQVLSVAWSSDSSRIASLEVDANTGILDIWDALTGARFSSYPVSQQALALAWSPDGKRIALAGGLAGAAQIWNGA